MLNLQAITREYVNKLQTYEQAQDSLKHKIKRAETRLENLKTKYHKMPYPHWMENYLTPIAETLTHEFPDSHFDLGGPFGLDNETSIGLYDKDNRLLAFLQFVHGDLDKGEFYLRDYTIDTGRFPKGSIAEMNGGNHPSISIPVNADINWFLDKIKYFDRVLEQWESAKVK